MTRPSTGNSLLPCQLRMALAVLGLLLVAPAAGGESDRVQGEPDGQQTEPATPQAARPQLKLPGLTVNVAERCVDIEATVCLDKGLLELVACTKGSKEVDLTVDRHDILCFTSCLIANFKGDAN